MNPLASTKCAGRLLMALAAISSILLMAACGSGGFPPPPNPGGFTTASLTGTYVFSSQGLDGSPAPLAVAGTLVADGKGGIAGGMIDIVDAANGAPPATAAQPIDPTHSSYSVATDGHGKATLTSSAYPTIVLDFVLTSTSHGLVTEFDNFGTGSGTIDLQTAVTSLSQLAGPYAFSLAGSDGNGNPFATAGAFTLNSSGASTTGVEDYNDNGNPVLDAPLTAAATVGSGTSPGAIALTTATFPLAFDFYPIDATHWKVIETDYVEFLAGDVFSQPSASLPMGNMVFTMGGGINGIPVAAGGLMNYNGTIFTGSEDVNNGGTVLAQVAFTGAPGIGAFACCGRATVGLTGFDPATQWVVYPSSGGLLMLETDSVNNVTLGAAFVQSATSFTASKGYGLNLTGENLNGGGGEVDDIAQFNATTATSNNMTGVVDENDLAITVTSALTGAYTPDSPATGRGSISATTPKTFIAGLTLEYYVVDASTILFIEVDSNPPQVAVGTFEQQSSSASQAAQSRVSMVRPAVRSHAAMWHK